MIIDNGSSFNESMQKVCDIETASIDRQNIAFQKAFQSISNIGVCQDEDLVNKVSSQLRIIPNNTNISFKEHLMILETKRTEEANIRSLREKLISSKESYNLKTNSNLIPVTNKSSLEVQEGVTNVALVTALDNIISEKDMLELERSLGISNECYDSIPEVTKHIMVNDPDVADVLNYLESHSSLSSKQKGKSLMDTATSPSKKVNYVYTTIDTNRES